MKIIALIVFSVLVTKVEARDKKTSPPSIRPEHIFPLLSRIHLPKSIHRQIALLGDGETRNVTDTDNVTAETTIQPNASTTQSTTSITQSITSPVQSNVSTAQPTTSTAPSGYSSTAYTAGPIQPYGPQPYEYQTSGATNPKKTEEQMWINFYRARPPTGTPYEPGGASGGNYPAPYSMVNQGPSIPGAQSGTPPGQGYQGPVGQGRPYGAGPTPQGPSSGGTQQSVYGPGNTASVGGSYGNIQSPSVQGLLPGPSNVQIPTEQGYQGPAKPVGSGYPNQNLATISPPIQAPGYSGQVPQTGTGTSGQQLGSKPAYGQSMVSQPQQGYMHGPGQPLQPISNQPYQPVPSQEAQKPSVVAPNYGGDGKVAQPYQAGPQPPPISQPPAPSPTQPYGTQIQGGGASGQGPYQPPPAYGRPPAVQGGQGPTGGYSQAGGLGQSGSTQRPDYGQVQPPPPYGQSGQPTATQYTTTRPSMTRPPSPQQPFPIGNQSVNVTFEMEDNDYDDDYVNEGNTDLGTRQAPYANRPGGQPASGQGYPVPIGVTPPSPMGYPGPAVPVPPAPQNPYFLVTKIPAPIGPQAPYQPSGQGQGYVPPANQMPINSPYNTNIPFGEVAPPASPVYQGPSGPGAQGPYSRSRQGILAPVGPGKPQVPGMVYPGPTAGAETPSGPYVLQPPPGPPYPVPPGGGEPAGQAGSYVVCCQNQRSSNTF